MARFASLARLAPRNSGRRVSAMVAAASVALLGVADAAFADSFTDKATGNGTLSRFAAAERVSVEVKTGGTKKTASKGYFASASKQASSSKAKKKKGTKVASLGGGGFEAPKPKRSLSGGGVNWVANAGCLAGSLKSVIYSVAAQFGSVTVNSTCRSKSHNARVGGAPKSYHLTGSAADFRVHGNVAAAASYIRGQVGGYKHYGGGLFHIDTGPRRPM